MRVPLILDAKKDCSRHVLQSRISCMKEVSPLSFRLPIFPLPLQLQPVYPCRSCCPAARQAAAFEWTSRRCCLERKIDRRKYDTGLQGRRTPVNSAAVLDFRYSQGSAGKYITRRLPFCSITLCVAIHSSMMTSFTASDTAVSYTHLSLHMSKDSCSSLDACSSLDFLSHLL